MTGQTLRHERQQEGIDGSDAVIGGKQQTNPVGPVGIGFRTGVRGPEMKTGHRRRGIDPHHEKRGPGKGLNPGQALHHRRHGVEVFQDMAEEVFGLANCPQNRVQDKSKPERGHPAGQDAACTCTRQIYSYIGSHAVHDRKWRFLGAFCYQIWCKECVKCPRAWKLEIKPTF